eukprot:COSAG06_NODE_40123_length_405_cov_0.839869_1_plen_45_part_10
MVQGRGASGGPMPEPEPEPAEDGDGLLAVVEARASAEGSLWGPAE